MYGPITKPGEPTVIHALAINTNGQALVAQSNGEIGIFQYTSVDGNLTPRKIFPVNNAPSFGLICTFPNGNFLHYKKTNKALYYWDLSVVDRLPNGYYCKWDKKYEFDTITVLDNDLFVTAKNKDLTIYKINRQSLSKTNFTFSKAISAILGLDRNRVLVVLENNQSVIFNIITKELKKVQFPKSYQGKIISLAGFKFCRHCHYLNNILTSACVNPLCLGGHALDEKSPMAVDDFYGVSIFLASDKKEFGVLDDLFSAYARYQTELRIQAVGWQDCNIIGLNFIAGRNDIQASGILLAHLSDGSYITVRPVVTGDVTMLPLPDLFKNSIVLKRMKLIPPSYEPREDYNYKFNEGLMRNTIDPQFRVEEEKYDRRERRPVPSNIQTIIEIRKNKFFKRATVKRKAYFPASTAAASLSLQQAKRIPLRMLALNQPSVLAPGRKLKSRTLIHNTPVILPT